jgi:organic radical activating enzyme
MTADQIVQECKSLIEGVFPHICITGGEPLYYPQLPVLLQALDKAFPVHHIHIETNGTAPYWHSDIVKDWPRGTQITVSPKTISWGLEHFLKGPYRWVSDIKFLVGPDGCPQYYDEFVTRGIPVFLMPIDKPGLPYPYVVRIKESLQTTMKILDQYPQYKLSLQLHKVLDIR